MPYIRSPPGRTGMRGRAPCPQTELKRHSARTWSYDVPTCYRLDRAVSCPGCCSSAMRPPSVWREVRVPQPYETRLYVHTPAMPQLQLLLGHSVLLHLRRSACSGVPRRRFPLPVPRRRLDHLLPRLRRLLRQLDRLRVAGGSALCFDELPRRRRVLLEEYV